MISRTRSLGWIVFLLLPVFGFGCKTSTRATPLNPNQNIPSIMPVTTPIPAPTQRTNSAPANPSFNTSADVVYLQQVMRNLLQVRSFRASMIVPDPQGTVTGEIEFVRQTGLHGTLRLPLALTSEVYLIGSNIYFRTNTSSWVDLSSKPEGQKAADLFRSAFSLNDKNTSLPISNSAKMLSVQEDPSPCRLYTFTQKTSEGVEQKNEICVRDDLPVRLRTYTTQGVVEVTYRDYNAAFEIVSPIKK